MQSIALVSAVLFAATTLTAPRAQEKADAVVEPSLKAPRGKLLEWKSTEGKTYWYKLPKDIDPKTPPDLLLMLHGTGLNHGWSFWNYPILGDFRRRDIVVSPDGMTPGQGDTFNFVQGPKDGDQIVGIITDFKKRLPTSRVYLYGHSQGAFFCYWFAGEHPELVDGIVAHAGNVLDVKHGKLAKQKVGIGILHGRADAVVTVECAIRTEKIYREQGYEKLKLEIVDGLTEQSGHWPLPNKVAEMLAWLDQVSTQSAAQAVRTAATELQRSHPDLGVVAEQVEKARKLLAKADATEKKELPPVIDAISAFLDKAMLLHSQALLADPGTTDPKAAYGPWVPRFLAANRSFGEHAEWKKAMVKPRELAKAHDKAVEKALKALDKRTKETRAAAAKAYEEAFLAERMAELHTTVTSALEAAGAAEDANLQRVKGIAAARVTATAEARKAAAALVKPALDELRAAAPSLFAELPNDDAK